MSSCKNMNVNMIACLSLMVMVGLMQQGATAAVYDVGGSLGWTVPPNTSFYSDWAASKTFQKGDVVIFNCTGNHTVAEVGKEEYDNCTNPGSWIASPLTYSPELTSSGGSRYFICVTGDHCERGQKVTITVGTSSSAPSSAPGPATFASLLGLIISTVALSFCTYM